MRSFFFRSRSQAAPSIDLSFFFLYTRVSMDLAEALARCRRLGGPGARALHWQLNWVQGCSRGGEKQRRISRHVHKCQKEATLPSVGGTTFFFSLACNAMAARPPTRPPSPRRRPTDADRGESAPPSAPARAHSVNTYARPSPHGNFARQPRSSLTYSADHIPAPRAAADLLGRAERPPHTISRAHNHPQRAAAHRAALPAKPAPHSTANRRTTQHTIQHTPARTQHRRRARDSITHPRTARARRTPPQRSTQSTLPISSSSTAQHSTQAHNTARHPAHTSARAAPQTHARLQHTRTHSTRAPHASATPHTEHTCPHQQQQQACHNPHPTHARPHSPLPARVLFAAERTTRTGESA